MSEDRVTSGDPLWDERFTLLPNLLLNHYVELGITDAELIFLLHLIKRGWYGKENAFPLYKTIAKETGKERDTIRGIARGLREKKLIKITPRYNEVGLQKGNDFSYQPLFDTLRSLALERREKQEGDNNHGGDNNIPLGGIQKYTPTEYIKITPETDESFKQTNHETTTDPAEQDDDSFVVVKEDPKTDSTDVVVKRPEYSEQARRDYSKGLASSWLIMVSVLRLIDSNKPPQGFFYELLGEFSYEVMFAQINAMKKSKIEQPDNLRGWYRASLRGNWNLENLTEEEKINEQAREEAEATRRGILEFEEEAKTETIRWESLSLEERAEERLQRRASFMKAVGTPLSEVQEEDLRNQYIQKYRGELMSVG